MKTRVLHVITRLDLGGAQQNTLFCVENHDRERFDVGLVAGIGGELDDQARAISDARVDLVPWLRHPIAPLRDAEAIGRLAVLFRRRRVEIVHTHSSKAGIVGRIAAWLAGVPRVVHTVHGWSFNDRQPAAVRLAFVALERFAARLTDRILVVAESDRRRGIALRIGSPERYRVLRSGIDSSAYDRPTRSREAVRSELGFGPGEIVVGTLACLKRQKAPLDFIEAARLARERDPRLKFFIAGDGPERASVERRIASAGLGRHVKLLGWRRDAADLLHAMDLFLLTSRFEGLPRAVLQAMAAGVPVIATEVDGTPEVVREGETGALIPPADPRAASLRVVELAADPALRERLSSGASARLGAEFDIGRMVRQLEREYLELSPKDALRAEAGALAGRGR